eukprot:TRINITY_DN2726_c0_g1_i1.p1 TRINITY_DN2726_c0_g1~~TRINITY_DN2726_c0_g1_i1.p1  ORF type:complete len:644 (-),score=90.18 TRINITY_DN2726_c0_g1_i1:461-2347(-)
MAFRSSALLVVSLWNVCLGSDNIDLQNRFSSFDKNGIARKKWLDDFRHAKSHCSWTEDVETLDYKYDWFPDDKTMRSSYWSYLTSQFRITTYYPQVPRWFINMMSYFFDPSAHKPDLQSHSCRIADHQGGEFRIRRLGPFVGKGGFDWHKMKLEDPYNLRSQMPPQGYISMTGFTAMPVDKDGEILGNPPIHIHHANLGPNPNRSSLSRVSQWHGDSQCSASDGGTACYITTLPEGFGFPATQELRLDIDFNDVRAPKSPEMHFWLETAIRIAKPLAEETSNEVGTVIIGVPFRMEWWKTSDFQRLYFVPPDQPSALWMTAEMPSSGTFVSGKLETHQHMFDTAWVFSGVSPEELGLNSDSWQLRKPWQPWIPKENGWTDDAAAMQALKMHVQARFQDVVRHCLAKPACAQKPPSLVWTLNRTVIEGDEEREMPWPSTTWTFEKGEQFTIVIFHKAMAHMMSHMTMAGPAAELAQHLAITGHYVPKTGTHAGYHFVLPSVKVDWAWYDSIDWTLTLLRFGGVPAPWSWLDAIVLLSVMLLTPVVLRFSASTSKQLRASLSSKLGKVISVGGYLRELFDKQMLIKQRHNYEKCECAPMELKQADEDSCPESASIIPECYGHSCVAEELP